jgi:hypothetical protein
MASDLLSKIRSELDERLSELRPVLSEYERLAAAADALASADSKAASLSTAKSPVSTARTPRSTPVRRDLTQAKVKKAPSGKPSPRKRATKRKVRAPRGVAGQAILAALEHGSHTPSELVTVTAMGGPVIRGNLRRLLAEGTIKKVERDGKTAYAVS